MSLAEDGYLEAVNQLPLTSAEEEINRKNHFNYHSFRPIRKELQSPQCQACFAE